MVECATVGELIDALGGTGAVARLIGVVPGSVSNWRAADRIPARWYFRFSSEGHDRGIKIPERLFREVSAA